MAPASKDSRKEQAAAPAAKTITITVPDFTANLSDPKHKFRLALLAILAVMFIFALFMFTRSSFAANDMFDVSRLQYNIEKLYSISFTLFIILFSLSMALAVYYGFGASRMEAALALAAVVVLALLYSFLAWAYAYAFLGFAAAVACSVVLASMSKDQSLSAAWGVTSKALMLLLIVAAFATYVKVVSNNQAYTNTFVNGLAIAAPQLVGQAVPGAAAAAAGNLQGCAQLLDQVSVTPSQIMQAYPQGPVTQAVSSGGGPIYQGLPQQVQQNVSAAAYAACITMSTQAANAVKTQASAAISNINVTQAVAQVNPSAIITPQLIEQIIQSVPLLSQMVGLLPIIAAMMVVSLVSLLNILVHVLSVLLVWMLKKVIG